jgi:hypothetical protein
MDIYLIFFYDYSEPGNSDSNDPRGFTAAKPLGSVLLLSRQVFLLMMILEKIKNMSRTAWK